MTSVLIVAIRMCIWAEDGAESLLLTLCENTMGSLGVARLKMVGLLTGRMGVLIVVALVLRRECETTGFVNVE